MKKILSVMMIALMVGAFASCNKKPSKAGAGADNDSTTVLLGQFFGSQFNMMANDTVEGKDFDKNEFMRGFVEAYEQNASYAQGKQTGQGIAQQLQMLEGQLGVKIDKDLLLQEIQKAYNGKPVTEEELNNLFTKVRAKMEEAQQKRMGAMAPAAAHAGEPSDSVEAAPAAAAPQAAPQAK